MECHAVWALNTDIHKSSSSGGVGYLLAKNIVSNGGVVYGCSGATPSHVRHVRVDSLADLDQLRGSKYVQSDTRLIFRKIKEDVKSGAIVLFVGTPCQCAAVNNLFRKHPDNLYVADLICHGVPSQKMLNDQLLDIVGKNGLGSIRSISFRDSNDYRFRINFNENKEVKSKEYNLWRMPYLREFFTCRSFRPSCYSCPYAGERRTSDLTLGDFWGIKNKEAMPLQSVNGISVVLINSERGKQLFNSVSESLYDEIRPLKEAVEGNTQLRHASRYTLHAKIFQTLYPTVPFRTASFITNIDSKAKAMLRIIKSRTGILR